MTADVRQKLNFVIPTNEHTPMILVTKGVEVT
jgi:hypothetical protein